MEDSQKLLTLHRACYARLYKPHILGPTRERESNLTSKIGRGHSDMPIQSRGKMAWDQKYATWPMHKTGQDARRPVPNKHRNNSVTGTGRFIPADFDLLRAYLNPISQKKSE